MPTQRPIPPSLNEAIMEVPEGCEGDEFFAAARDALKQGRVAAEKAATIASSTLANEMMTPAARHRAARDRIYSVTRPALERLQKVIDRLGAKTSALDEFLRGPPAPTNAVAQMQAMEIRSALAVMSREDRRKTIIRAIHAHDTAVAMAVLRGPTFVTGISPEEQAQFRLDWQQTEHKAQAEHLAHLKKLAEHVERGGKLLLGYSAGLTDSRVIEQAEKTERRANEAASLSA